MLADLRRELARVGLHVTRVVTQAALDQAQVPLCLTDLLAGARSGLLVGDGGGTFFAGFSADLSARLAPSPLADPDPDPLDSYTAQVVPAAAIRALGRQPFAVCYPFSRGRPLPVQSIGRAAGLPGPGPLGLQIHPHFGPWWAYRALLVLAEPLSPEPALPDSCALCPAPCLAACPGQAPARAGLQVARCLDHRLSGPDCAHSCASRLACVVGPQHGYPAQQLAFHMGRSLTMIRRYRQAGRT